MVNISNLHKPVLLKEVLENLHVKDGGVYVDATFGRGGYSRAILNKSDCQLYAFDRDPNVIDFAKDLKQEFGDNFYFISDKFSNMQARLEEIGVAEIDGIVLDLGVSSMQLDNEDRGFSFNSSARLDMRMNNSQGISAFEVVNYKSESELSNIIKNFGEEKKHRQIARNIVLTRAKNEITTALELSKIIQDVYKGQKIGKINPATKTFQAIRIFVNNELEELKKVLNISLNLLKKGGRLLVVSFHSLEDSCVKSFFRKYSGYKEKNISRYDLRNLSNQEPQKYPLSIAFSKAIKPSEEEIKDNIRSRSSRLRVAIKN
jgi:16S rRNA (cytosine1402-N4)-methyltransferase